MFDLDTLAAFDHALTRLRSDQPASRALAVPQPAPGQGRGGEMRAERCPMMAAEAMA